MNPGTLTLTSAGVLAALIAMAGCSPRDNNSATAPSTGTASTTTSEAVAGVKAAADKAGDKVADAVITTSVKAELAKDTMLSMLKINVDTDNGRVALRGTAPSNEARERATTLAGGVKGVLAVDNQLTVEPAKS
jgi:hyperosmotically inducible periplasmic protein